MANKSKNGVFNLSGISIIACDCLQAVICIFIDLFFVSKILNTADLSAERVNMSHQIITIGAFYAIDYLCIIFSYLINGHILRKINKSIFVSIGAILLAAVVLLVYFLQDNLMTFVPLIATIYGMGIFLVGIQLFDLRDNFQQTSSQIFCRQKNNVPGGVHNFSYFAWTCGRYRLFYSYLYYVWHCGAFDNLFILNSTEKINKYAV